MIENDTLERSKVVQTNKPPTINEVEFRRKAWLFLFCTRKDIFIWRIAIMYITQTKRQCGSEEAQKSQRQYGRSFKTKSTDCSADVQ